MKTLITSALVATLATGAFAGKSDRYHDNRFDTAVGHVTNDTAATKAETRKTPRSKAVAISTRNKRQSAASGSYAYSNPYGVGPNNDSR